MWGVKEGRHHLCSTVKEHIENSLLFFCIVCEGAPVNTISLFLLHKNDSGPRQPQAPHTGPIYMHTSGWWPRAIMCPLKWQESLAPKGKPVTAFSIGAVWGQGACTPQRATSYSSFRPAPKGMIFFYCSLSQNWPGEGQMDWFSFQLNHWFEGYFKTLICFRNCFQYILSAFTLPTVSVSGHRASIMFLFSIASSLRRGLANLCIIPILAYVCSILSQALFCKDNLNL